MLGRFGQLIHAWLVALDQLAYVTLASPAFLIGLSDPPSPHETISSAFGRHANLGFHWAIVAQRLIDRLFELLGSPPGHCQRAIVRADWLKFPLT